ARGDSHFFHEAMAEVREVEVAAAIDRDAEWATELGLGGDHGGGGGGRAAAAGDYPQLPRAVHLLHQAGPEVREVKVAAGVGHEACGAVELSLCRGGGSGGGGRAAAAGDYRQLPRAVHLLHQAGAEVRDVKVAAPIEFDAVRVA